MKDFDINDEEVDKELIINDSSIHSLVEELKNHPRKERKYSRLAALANKRVAALELELEILVAELIDRGMKELNITTASGRQELRKAGIAKYPEYQEKRKELYEAKEVADIFNGLVNAWNSRGYRLMEIVKVADRSSFDSPRVYRSEKSLKSQSDRLSDELD